MPDQKSRPPLQVVKDDASPHGAEPKRAISLAEAERIWARSRQEPIEPPSWKAIQTRLRGRKPPGRLEDELGRLPVRGSRRERKREEQLVASRRRR